MAAIDPLYQFKKTVYAQTVEVWDVGLDRPAGCGGETRDGIDGAGVDSPVELVYGAAQKRLLIPKRP